VALAAGTVGVDEEAGETQAITVLAVDCYGWAPPELTNISFVKCRGGRTRKPKLYVPPECTP